MAGSGQDSSDPPEGPRPPRKPRSLTPLAAMRAQVHEGAKELVVDEFVDTYFQERPKTLPPISPRGTEPPAPPPEPPRRSPPRPGHLEESGVRLAPAVAAQARGSHGTKGSQVPSPPTKATSSANVEPTNDDAIELSVAEHEEGLVVMEAELADRDDKISTLEEELDKLRGELGALRSSRGTDLVVPVSAAPVVQAPPAHVPAPSPDVRGARSLRGGAAAAPPPAPDPPALAPPAPAAPPETFTPRPAHAVDAPAPSQGRNRIRSVIGVLLALAAVSAGVVGVAKGLHAEAAKEGPVAPARVTASPAEAPPVPSTTAGEPPAAGSLAPATTAPPPQAPSAEPPPAEPPPSDGLPPLLSFQAWLTVKSPVDAEVVVQGQPVGRTNQRLLTRCGPRNVRLRRDGSWLSPGEHVRIVCMEHTEIRVNPSK